MAAMGKLACSAFSSCRQTTSGDSRASHSRSCGRRRTTLLMLKLAILNGFTPPSVCTGSGRLDTTRAMSARNAVRLTGDRAARLWLLGGDELVAGGVGLDPEVLVLVEQPRVVHHQSEGPLLAGGGIDEVQDLDRLAAVLALDLAAGAAELALGRPRQDLAAVPLLDVERGPRVGVRPGGAVGADVLAGAVVPRATERRLELDPAQPARRLAVGRPGAEEGGARLVAPHDLPDREDDPEVAVVILGPGVGPLAGAGDGAVLDGERAGRILQPAVQRLAVEDRLAVRAPREGARSHGDRRPGRIRRRGRVRRHDRCAAGAASRPPGHGTACPARRGTAGPARCGSPGPAARATGHARA